MPSRARTLYTYCITCTQEIAHNCKCILSQGAEGEQAVTLSQLLDVASQASVAPELVLAAAGCATQRLSMLAERMARLRFSCPLVTAAAGDDNGDDGAGAEAR